MIRNSLITTWARFEESMKNHFGPLKYKDPNEALSKLLQLGTVKDDQREFEKLINRVTDIPDSLLISFYISRLKQHLQRELLVSKPTIEARFDDQADTVAGTSAGLKANKVVNDGDDSESSDTVTSTSNSESSSEVKVLSWVQQVIDVESTYDNDVRDQASELETKMLVEGKQDEAKVVVVADEQNSDKPYVLKGNGVIVTIVELSHRGWRPDACCSKTWCETYPKVMEKMVRWLDDKIPRSQIPTLRKDLLGVARFPRWMEAKVVSFEDESENGEDFSYSKCLLLLM
uniref:Uncharacterized protein n=1 Tax=Tanacetum cinerariifolium TaxID=118510 RepID=A0A699HV98_TANCI|nr:hypothetical protein [Tanacetum cinerariifolium]